MTKPLHETVTKNVDSTSKAFIASDFTFFGDNCRPITNNKRQTAPFVHITWRFQKNGQNGEEIPFARNNTKPQFCAVRAAYRIIKRAERLNQTKNLPIAISVPPNKKTKGLTYLTSTFIYKQLKLAAHLSLIHI